MMRQRMLLLPLLESLHSSSDWPCERDRCDQIVAQLEAQLPCETIAERAGLRNLILAYWQDAILLTALRDPDAPEYAVQWQTVCMQVQYALRLLDRDCAQEQLVLSRLRDRLGRYNYQSRLATWIAVEVVRLAQECARSCEL